MGDWRKGRHSALNCTPEQGICCASVAYFMAGDYRPFTSASETIAPRSGVCENAARTASALDCGQFAK